MIKLALNSIECSYFCNMLEGTDLLATA